MMFLHCVQAEMQQEAAKKAEAEAEAAARRAERFKKEKQSWLEQQRKEWKVRQGRRYG